MDALKVAFCDFAAQYAVLQSELDAAFRRVCASGWYILGREVAAFEEEFALWCGAAQGVGVASGTDALRLALMALDINPGAEVITAANAGVPTVAAIVLQGARPVFADVESGSLTLSTADAARHITPRTRALLPIHLYGQCADMDPLLDLARQHHIPVIEDACQAHGASLGPRRAGTLGTLACFSFYPTKNLGAVGDGGMVLAQDKGLADRVRQLRDYGQSRKFHQEILGTNSRLDELQAALLRVKLPHLTAWNQRRIEIARRYRELIHNPAVSLPAERPGGTHVYHLYAVRCARRDALAAHLAAQGVQTMMHYPLPAYRQEAYRDLKLNSDCPETERACAEVLSLPLYPELRDDEVAHVAATVNSFKP